VRRIDLRQARLEIAARGESTDLCESLEHLVVRH
jgi:hypothetical protein